MANVQIGYNTSTGVFTIPDTTTLHGAHGIQQAITFTQAPPTQGWSLYSINFGNSEFSLGSGGGNGAIVINDAFTDATTTSHKYTVTVTVGNTTPPTYVTSPDPVIVNEPSSVGQPAAPPPPPKTEPKPQPQPQPSK